MLLGSALCCWVLPCAAGFCLVLLGSALCCWVLPCAAGFCLVLLGSALCCWVLPCAAGFCLVLLGSALCCWVLVLLGSAAAAGFCLLVLRQCAMPQCAQYFACRLPLHVIQPSHFTFREFAAARARISFASRFDLVFDLVFPGLDFLVLVLFPLPCPSLVALWYLWLVLLPSSCSLLWAGAAGGCLLQLVSLFAWSLFLVSACPVLLGGRGVKKTITLLRVIPTMTFTRFVTGKSSGILSDISFGIRSGILSGISSGILPGKHSIWLVAFYLAYLLAFYLAFYLANLLAFYLANILASGIPCGILSGISSVMIFWHSI